MPYALDGNYVRLDNDQVDFRIRSNTRWVFLAIFLVLVVTALVILIVET